MSVTRTIVQTLDESGRVVYETVTTVEVKPVEEPEETFGLYL